MASKSRVSTNMFIEETMVKEYNKNMIAWEIN
jgi:hypothetical protein